MKDIIQQSQRDYHDFEKNIIGILLLNPANPQALSILRGMDYYNSRSGIYFNFYIPGQAYRPKWDYGEEQIFARFIADSFSLCIHQLEDSMPNYHYSGKPELLLFNAHHGVPSFKNTIILQLEELKNSSGQDFEKIFEIIYQNIVFLNAASLDDVSVDMVLEVTHKSLIDSLKHLLERIPIIRNFVRNSRGIYFIAN